MLNSDPSSRVMAEVLATKTPVSRSELKEFHRNNRDEALIEAYAHYARLQKPQLRHLSDDKIIVLFLKEQTHDVWRQNISTGLILSTMGARFAAGADHIVTNISNEALGKADTLSNFVLRYVPVDLTLETEEISETDQQVIVPEKTDDDITGFLEKVKVPPDIAADVQSLLLNNFPVTGMTNLAAKILNEYQKIEPEDTSGCGSDHAERRRRAKASRT